MVTVQMSEHDMPYILGGEAEQGDLPPSWPW
jgi:hypothetical protein